MGTLRTLFAISVVFYHSVGIVFVGPRNAVQLFYMISGFLISYVLVEKKAYSTVTSFYVNRYLRLYPIYVTVAFLTLIAFTFISVFRQTPAIFRLYEQAPIAANVLLIVSNATLFLQDWTQFLGVRNGELVLASNFADSAVGLYRGLLVPQAWTLGVELLFYLIAPFVLVRKRLIFLLLFLSIALRLYHIQIGLGMSSPWTHGFFPTELSLFLLGALAHQIGLPYYRKLFSSELIEIVSSIATYTLIAITLTYWLIPVDELTKTLTLFLVFLILMPLAFVYQSRREWDKQVGDLSYPIYICHLLVLHVVSFVFHRAGITERIIIGVSTVLLSIGFSIVLNKYIANPIEDLRNRFRRGGSPARKLDSTAASLREQGQVSRTGIPK